MGTWGELHPSRRDGSGENPAVHRHGNQAGAVRVEGPYIVVATSSTLGNWYQEFQKFS